MTAKDRFLLFMFGRALRSPEGRSLALATLALALTTPRGPELLTSIFAHALTDLTDEQARELQTFVESLKFRRGV